MQTLTKQEFLSLINGMTITEMIGLMPSIITLVRFSQYDNGLYRIDYDIKTQYHKEWEKGMGKIPYIHSGYKSFEKIVCLKKMLIDLFKYNHLSEYKLKE